MIINKGAYDARLNASKNMTYMVLATGFLYSFFNTFHSLSKTIKVYAPSESSDYFYKISEILLFVSHILGFFVYYRFNTHFRKIFNYYFKKILGVCLIEH